MSKGVITGIKNTETTLGTYGANPNKKVFVIVFLASKNEP